MDQRRAYEAFKALHEGPDAFVMANAWDGASAVLLKSAGLKALATSSAAIAYALGRQDGRHAVNRAWAVANGSLIARLTDLPVNGDLEDGFGPAPKDVAATIEAGVAGGLAGVGIEDTTADPDHPIHDFDVAVERMRHAAKVAKGRILLTGRTDNYLHGRPDLEDTIRRLVAFAEVGADVLYAPLLPDMDSIAKVVKAVSPKPVNILIGPAAEGVKLADLSAIGVKRVSLGSATYMHAMMALARSAALLVSGDLDLAFDFSPGTSLASLLPE
jgi:2-methylisocitrate lyase-like PEP mutase family enzyme